MFDSDAINSSESAKLNGALIAETERENGLVLRIITFYIQCV
jgi:hypothetical protein